MPVDYSRYPPDWKERRDRIRARAGYRCEKCGAPEGWIRINHGDTEVLLEPDHADSYLWSLEHWDPEESVRVVEIQLGIAHLDHDEENWNVTDDRLAALCRRCHARYDAPEHRRRRAKRKYENSLFPVR